MPCLLRRAAAVAVASLVLADGAAGTCAGDAACSAAGDEPDVQALLATTVAKGSRVSSTAKVAKVKRHQRADDNIFDVPPPEPLSPEAPSGPPLPVPEPLPAPNPANSSFINGYMPMYCMTEDWPWFTQVEGVWTGSQGQNFISLPQANVPDGKMFLVQVNRYTENITFQRFAGILNRGYTDGIQVPPVNQSDQTLTGVSYETNVVDLDLNEGIHHENGFVLHQSCIPMNGALMDNWQIMRMGAIPHGTQPMGFGNITVVKTPTPDYYQQMLIALRDTFVFSVQPFVPGCGPQSQQQRNPGDNTGPFATANGAQCCIGGGGYMRGAEQCPPTGCPEPIDMLIQAVQGLNVVEYIQLNISTQDTIGPYMPQGMWRPGIRGGGMQNTAYVNINVMAEDKSFRNINWLLTVKREDGSIYYMMQYIQTVNLKFLAAAAGCPDQVWPHVDANTLTKMEEPPMPMPTPMPTPSEKGNCYNLLCGGCKFHHSWCNHDRCSLGPWCSKSEAACHMCLGKWCPEE